MNKETYLKFLEDELKNIPEEDREDAISYYNEYFDDSPLTEEETAQKLGSLQSRL